MDQRNFLCYDEQLELLQFKALVPKKEEEEELMMVLNYDKSKQSCLEPKMDVIL